MALWNEPGRGFMTAAAFATVAVAALPPLPIGGLPPAGPPSGPPVYTFPTPGSRANLPAEQIAFRGRNPRGLVRKVTGSQSGAHAGVVALDSDGSGGSFIPRQPFAPGETVTVSTSMRIVGGTNGSFRFKIAVPASRNPYNVRVFAHRVRGDIERFHSRQDLAPSAVRVVRQSRHTARGDIFLTPQSGPVQDGPMIRDWRGRLIWFKRVPKNQYAGDFKVQTLHGQPVLTWWQGFINNGVGYGEDVIADNRYQTVATVQPGDGLAADQHEFSISRENTAFVTSYTPIYWDERPYHAASHAAILDSVIQEIDIPTGLVLFEWHALDHLAVGDSYQKGWRVPTAPWDYFHINSIQELHDGNLLISARNTWAAYEISRKTAAVLWSLGGRHSSFRMGPGTRFAFQHDVRRQRSGLVTVFDDGGGPPPIHRQSRVLGLRVNASRHTASLAFAYVHKPPLLSFFEGNVQRLPNRDYFVGWGQDPYFSEYDSHGRLIFDARFVADVFQYRSYRFRWNATPTTPPAIAASSRGRSTTVWVSWNGATNVAGWRVYAGAKRSSLHAVRVFRDTAFETAISIRRARYVAVVAVDARRRPISGRSAVIRA